MYNKKSGRKGKNKDSENLVEPEYIGNTIRKLIGDMADALDVDY